MLNSVSTFLAIFLDIFAYRHQTMSGIYVKTTNQGTSAVQDATELRYLTRMPSSTSYIDTRYPVPEDEVENMYKVPEE